MNINHIWNSVDDLLSPTIFHPQYFLKVGEYRCLEVVKKYAAGTFLDLGCGRQWYRYKIEKYVSKYLALDHPKYRKRYHSKQPIEITADITKMPLPPNYIDTALLMSVLEHLPDPQKALREIHRILKTKARLIIFSVENYPSHDFPPNYNHFTKLGLKELLARNGFEVMETTTLGNFWETQVVYQNVYLMHFVKSWLPLLFFFAPIMVLGNIFALLLGRKLVTEEFSLGHIMVASKK